MENVVYSTSLVVETVHVNEASLSQNENDGDIRQLVFTLTMEVTR